MNRIVFKATKEQLLQMMANAVNASAPVGLGALHFRSKIYTPEELERYLYGTPDEIHSVDMDYVDGRMVKLFIHAIHVELYVMRYEFQPAYQSFYHKYPTGASLLESVGIEDFKVEAIG